LTATLIVNQASGTEREFTIRVREMREAVKLRLEHVIGAQMPHSFHHAIRGTRELGSARRLQRQAAEFETDHQPPTTQVHLTF
jgi:hypothetical protein